MKKLVTLSIDQKRAIVKERARRQTVAQKHTNAILAEWAKETFSLPARPGKATMSRILNNKDLHTECFNSSQSKFRNRGVKYDTLDKELYNWICDMQHRRLCISGALIQSKAASLACEANKTLSDDCKISLVFSEGWLHKFKKRWGLRAFRLHGESGDVDDSVVDAELEKLQQEVEKYNLNDVFNCDESALFYQMAPDRTIAPSTFSGRKTQKARFTFHACVNATGNEKLPLMFIGTSLKPRCFKKKTGEQLGLYYRNNKKAWMNGGLFSEWLHSVDRVIGKTPGRNILLLMDNCSAHGSEHTLPALQNVKVSFLPPNTTSRLQPLDAGIIAALKMRYRKKQMEYAVDQLDVGATDIYKVDILLAMRWLSIAWNDISADKIRNCWGTTGIVPAYDCDTSTEDNVTMAEIENYVGAVVPQSRRIHVSELLTWEQEIEVTQQVSDADAVENIISSGELDAADDDCDEIGSNTESDLALGTLQNQLGTLSHAKRIMEANGVYDESVLSCIRRLQFKIREKRLESLQQTHIDSYFSVSS